MRRTRKLRGWLPLAVSVGVLAWLLGRDDIDLGGVVRSVDLRAAALFTLVLLLYGAVSLAIEARTLVRMVGTPAAQFSAWMAARIKAASYLAYAIHYTVGVGALSVLLRRRAGLSLADSVGVVLLIASMDLGIVLLFAGLGAATLGAEGPAVRAGVIFAASATLVGGLAVLRAPRLGPLERLRRLAIFRAARETPVVRIGELFGTRLVFVLWFFCLAGVALPIFGIHPPLPDLFLKVSLVVLVGALPIAVSGLGTTQAAFVYLFRGYGDPETLFACSLALTLGLILLRAGMGLLFAREYAREAIETVRGEEA